MLTDILTAPYGTTFTMDNSMGLITPISFIPHPVLPYSKEMTFLQRVFNAFLTGYELLFWRFNYMPAHNKLAQKYFKDSIEGEMPHVIRVEKETSVILVNEHKSFNLPRPSMPGQVDIAGAHIRTAFMPIAELNVSYGNKSLENKINIQPVLLLF